MRCGVTVSTGVSATAAVVAADPPAGEDDAPDARDAPDATWLTWPPDDVTLPAELVVSREAPEAAGALLARGASPPHAERNATSSAEATRSLDEGIEVFTGTLQKGN